MIVLKVVSRYGMFVMICYDVVEYCARLFVNGYSIFMIRFLFTFLV